jgi:hypothetical protein
MISAEFFARHQAFFRPGKKGLHPLPGCEAPPSMADFTA